MSSEDFTRAGIRIATVCPVFRCRWKVFDNASARSLVEDPFRQLYLKIDLKARIRGRCGAFCALGRHDKVPQKTNFS